MMFDCNDYMSKEQSEAMWKYFDEHPEISPMLEDGTYMSMIDWMEKLNKKWNEGIHCGRE